MVGRWEDTRSMEHILEDFERKKCQACLKIITDEVKALTFYYLRISCTNIMF